MTAMLSCATPTSFAGASATRRATRKRGQFWTPIRGQYCAPIDIPEGRRVFATLSVEENLRLGTAMPRASKGVEAQLQRTLTHFPRLRERRRMPAGALSGGEQQMLAIGRALMTRPRLILVDEPSLGLAPLIVDQVYESLHALRREDGLTLLINEQSSKRVLKYADRIYVIRGGEVRLNDYARNLQDGAAIMQAYFGFGGSSPDRVEA
jgi:branched-chain amino acid transport system ATP-binding protein